MSKFTIVLLLVALVAMTIAKPQGVNVVDADSQINVVDADSQVNVVDGDAPTDVNVVEPIDNINPRGPQNK